MSPSAHDDSRAVKQWTDTSQKTWLRAYSLISRLKEEKQGSRLARLHEETIRHVIICAAPCV